MHPIGRRGKIWKSLHGHCNKCEFILEDSAGVGVETQPCPLSGSANELTISSIS